MNSAGRIGRSLVIRADASQRTGSGHVMRMMALAQGWRDAGGTAFLVAAELPEALEIRVREGGMAVKRIDAAVASPSDASSTIGIAAEEGAAWVVLDGYSFGPEFHSFIRAAGIELMVVDDIGHLSRYDVDAILNQNSYASEAMYPERLPQTKLLLGSPYALIREEFLVWRNRPKSIPERGSRIVVTLGGADPDDATPRIVEGLADLDAEVIVILGGGNPHAPPKVPAGATARFEIVRDRRDMPDLLRWADLAVSGAGSTCWELAVLGVPGVLTILAENQVRIAEHLEAIGAAKSLGWASGLEPSEIGRVVDAVLKDKALRVAMSKAGSHLVDGGGAGRATAELW